MVNGNKKGSNSQGKLVPAIKSEKPSANMNDRISKNAQNEVNLQENQLQDGTNYHNVSAANYANSSKVKRF